MRPLEWGAENKPQIARRLTPEFLRQTLQSFHQGRLDALSAAEVLGVSRAHLFRLRRAWMRQPDSFASTASGGNHQAPWPQEVQDFLQHFLPLQRPPNYQLVADELLSRFAFLRDRKSVATYARRHFPLLVRPANRFPKPRRRWERSRIGELWQHDSSIHSWWPAAAKQTLLLTLDDHSRKYLAATFVPTDTTWNHFEHFRRALGHHGRPTALYTDGLALFGHQSSTEGGDPRSEFQRAFTALGVSHLVAPSPQAKGKIERRFGTFQKRLVALLAFEKICDFATAQLLLDQELARQNRTVCRTSGLSPNDACGPKLRRKAATPCVLHQIPASWTSIWPFTSPAAAMPITTSTSWAAVGPSGPPSAAPSPSSTTQAVSFGSLLTAHSPQITAGPISSPNSPSDPVSFCSHIKSPFELPPKRRSKMFAVGVPPHNNVPRQWPGRPLDSRNRQLRAYSPSRSLCGRLWRFQNSIPTHLGLMKLRRHLGAMSKPIALIGVVAIGLGLIWLRMAGGETRPPASFADFRAKSQDPSVPMNPLISFEAINESDAEWTLVVNGGHEPNSGRFDAYSMNLGSFPAFSTNHVEFTAPFNQTEFKFQIRILKRANFRERLRRAIQSLREDINFAGFLMNLDLRHNQNVTILVTETPTVTVGQ